MLVVLQAVVHTERCPAHFHLFLNELFQVPTHALNQENAELISEQSTIAATYNQTEGALCKISAACTLNVGQQMGHYLESSYSDLAFPSQ